MGTTPVSGPLPDEAQQRAVALRHAREALGTTTVAFTTTRPVVPIKKVSLGNYTDALVYLAEYILNGEEPPLEPVDSDSEPTREDDVEEAPGWTALSAPPF